MVVQMKPSLSREVVLEENTISEDPECLDWRFDNTLLQGYHKDSVHYNLIGLDPDESRLNKNRNILGSGSPL